MSLVSQISALTTRVATEFKSVRTEISNKANSLHNHSAADITSGSLSPNRLAADSLTPDKLSPGSRVNNLNYNSSFEDWNDSVTVPIGWALSTTSTEVGALYSRVAGLSGLYGLRMEIGSGGGARINQTNSMFVPCSPGDRHVLTLKHQALIGTSNVQIRLTYWTGRGSGYISTGVVSSLVNSTAAPTLKTVTSVAEAPANAAFVMVQCNVTGPSGNAVVVDDFELEVRIPGISLLDSSIGPVQLADGTVNVKKLNLGDLGNYIADALLLDSTMANWSQPPTYVAPSGITPAYIQWANTASGNAHRINSCVFEAKLGDKFYFEAEVSAPASNTVNATVSACLTSRNASGTAITYPQLSGKVVAPGSDWSVYSGVITITHANAISALFTPFIAPTPGSPGQIVRMRKMVLRRIASSSLSAQNDVSTAGLKVGDTLVWNGSLWVPLPNSSVSAADIPPASPNAMDDEFDDGVFDTSKWTLIDTNGETITENEFGQLSVKYNANENRFRGIYQPCPSGPWKFRAKVRNPAGLDTADRSYIALFVSTAASPNYRTVGLWNSNTPRAVSYTTVSSAASNWASGTTFYQAYYYIELELSAANLLTSRISHDGVTWFQQGTAASFVPVNIGLGWENNRGYQLEYLFDWFRRIS